MEAGQLVAYGVGEELVLVARSESQRLALLAPQRGRGRTGALGEAVVADRMVEHYMSWLLTVFR